jgi:putative addiction module CopG family antidote
MSISLPEGLRKFVEGKVKAGGYESASEYVRALILQAKEREKKEDELRELLLIGQEELKRGAAGEYEEASLPELFEKVKARARARLPSKRKRTT